MQKGSKSVDPLTVPEHFYGELWCVLKSMAKIKVALTLNLIEKPFNTFTDRADPDQAALVRAA